MMKGTINGKVPVRCLKQTSGILQNLMELALQKHMASIPYYNFHLLYMAIDF